MQVETGGETALRVWLLLEEWLLPIGLPHR